MNCILLLITTFLLIILSVYAEETSKDRVSLRKCKEYCKNDTTVEYFSRLSLFNNETMKHEVPKCRPWHNLISGGIKVENSTDFPHTAAIGWKNSDGTDTFRCGGALISERFVLTVAHCRKINENDEYRKPTFVRLGDLDLRSVKNTGTEKDYEIEDFIIHNNYKTRTSDNDIALIKLKTEVEFSDYIKPACLQQEDILGNDKVIATGWGQTDSKSETSDVLLKVELTVVNNTVCFELVKDDIKAEELTSGQMCAGGESKDICLGDSGGPLHELNKDCICTRSIVGITSYGVSTVCGSPMPSIYARISSYIDWIERIVWPNEI